MLRTFGLFGLASLVVLLATVCTTGGRPPQEETGLIPAKANVLFNLRLADILKDQEITQSIDQLIEASPEEFSTEEGQYPTLDTVLDQAAEEAGIDPRNITEILLFGDVADGDYFAVFVKGSFRESAVLSALESEEGPLNKGEYKGQEIHTDPDEDVSIAFLKPETVLLGYPEAVRDVIDIKTGDTQPLQGPLAEAFDALGSSLVRAAISVPEGQLLEEGLPEEAPFPGFSPDLLTKIRFLAASLDKRGDVITSSLSLDYPEPGTARRAVEAFEGLRTLTGAFIADAKLAEQVKGVEVEAVGSSARITSSVKIDEIAGLLQSIRELGPELFPQDLFGGARIFGGASAEAIPPPVPAEVVPEQLYIPADPVTGRQHVPLGTRVTTYLSDPPTSGPHWSQPGVAPIPWGIYSSPIPDEILVHNLEHGGIVIHYWSGADPELVRQLEEFVLSQPAGVTGFVLAPRDGLQAPVALRAWEYYLALPGIDGHLQKFVFAHYGQGPEPLSPGQ